MKKISWILLLCVTIMIIGPGSVYAKEAKDIHVALIVKNLVNPFFVYMQMGGEAAAKKYGVQYTCLAPERTGDVEAQIRIMEDLIQKGIDAIVIVPIDSRGIVSGIERANKVGVPIFVSNTRAHGGEFVAFAGIDHVAMARAMGKYIVEKLNGTGKVIELEGKTGAQSSIDRGTGFNEVFSQETGIERLVITPADYQKAKAMSVTEDLLIRFPEIDVIACYNDSMALGAIEALKAAGRLEQTMVTGTDANQDALESIEKGELTATVDSDPFSQAFVPVEAAIKYVMNGEVPPKEIIVGEGTATVIDKDNIAEFKENLAKRLEEYGIEPK